MNRLMRQAFEPDQIRGRESRVRVDRANKKIGELTMENEILRMRMGEKPPLRRRRSRK